MAKSKKSKSVIPVNTISGNAIEVNNQIVWDSASLQVMEKVAQGLLNLTELFKKQEIVLDSMVKLDGAQEVLISGVSLTNNQTTNSTTGINFKS